MRKRWFIGLSSGSSFQGVHAALVEASHVGLDARLRLLHSLHRPYPAELRELLWRFSTTQPPEPRQMALVHRVLGEWYTGAIFQLVEQAQAPLHDVMCIGFPGQMIRHDPEGRHPTTLTLGMPEVVAEKTGITTICQFRARDIVVGGTGYPMIALIDNLILGQSHADRLLVHLGGWAHALLLPGEEPPRRMTGFQAVPCGILLDGILRQLTGGKEPFDAWGKHGVQGRCIEPLLERWLQHPVLQARPPRALSIEDFGENFITQGITYAKSQDRSLHDVLCTATHFVAQGLAQAVRKFLPGAMPSVILSGGGVRNGFLLRLLEQAFAPLPLEKLDDHGWPAESRQAVGYAGLAMLTLDGIPGNVPSVTGGSGTRLLGTLTPGSTGNWSRCLGWMAQQMAPFRAAA